MLNTHGSLALLIITQALSLIGSRMTSVGIGLWLFQKTGAATPLLLVSFFNEISGVVISGFAGVAADRYDRKRVMMLADGGQALCSLLLLVCLATDVLSTNVWLLFAIVFVQGGLSMLQSPAKSASIALLIPDRHRDRINGLQEMIFPFAGIAAPALTGAVFALGGVTAVIAIDLLTFVVAAVAYLFMRIPRPSSSGHLDSEEHRAHANLLAQLREGVRYLATQQGLRNLLIYITVMNFLLNGSLELSLPYVVTITGSEVITGAVLSAMSVGALTGGALIAARGTVHRRIRLLLLGSALVAFMYVAYGVARSPWALAVAVFVLLIPLPMGRALMNSLLQSRVPPHLQGRVFALESQLGFVGSTTSFVLIGPLVDRVLEPAVGSATWRVVAPLVGAQPGAGMALLMVITGILIALSTLLVSLSGKVRALDRA